MLAVLVVAAGLSDGFRPEVRFIMLEALRRHASNIAVAAVTAALVAGGPSIAATITNADKVDGKDAVSASATVAKRAGKLVATNASGYLPDYIVSNVSNASYAQTANTLDGWDSTHFFSGGTAVQVNDTEWLAVGASRAWLTTSWPIGWQVQWSVLPGVYAGRMKLDVEIERNGSDYTKLNYLLRVTNTGAYATPYKLRYVYTGTPVGPSAAAARTAERKALDEVKVKRIRE